MAWTGDSQQVVAGVLECSQMQVSRMLARKSPVSIEMAGRIEKASASWPAGPIGLREWVGVRP